MKNDVPWVWSETQEAAFKEVKSAITNTPVLAFYDPSKEITLENDSCEYGLGSVLATGGTANSICQSAHSLTRKQDTQTSKEKC